MQRPSKTNSSDTRVVIGWTEYVDLPDWGVRGLRAKIDTGARSSALHVENLRTLPHGMVSFDVVLRRRQRKRTMHLQASVRRRARVRSSTGHVTERVFVATMLRLGPIEREIEISLVDREPMIHRMLLGRNALDGELLIAAGRRFGLGRPARRRTETTQGRFR